MAKLVFTDKNHAGNVYELTLERTTVGRSDQNTLVIADGSLSAVHCEILVNGAEVIVRDLGSRNGTFVNGMKLANQQSQLKSGQTVRFGSVEARLQLDGPSPDETVSEITAVHAMGRIMRDQKRDKENPRPTDASMKLGAPDSNPIEDRTITAPGTPMPKETAVPVPAPARSQPEHSSKKPVIVIAVVALGLIVLFWLLWGRK